MPDCNTTPWWSICHCNKHRLRFIGCMLCCSGCVCRCRLGCAAQHSRSAPLQLRGSQATAAMAAACIYICAAEVEIVLLLRLCMHPC